MRPFVACWLTVVMTTVSFALKAESTIIDALSKNPNTKIFAEALAKVGLNEELVKKPAVTVIALTDEGFNKLTNKDQLLADKNHLSAFLKTYIVEQNIDFSRDGTAQYDALDGRKMKVGPGKQVNDVPVNQEERADKYSVYTLNTPIVTTTKVGSLRPWNGEWQSTLFDFSWLSPWKLPLNQIAVDAPLFPKAMQDLRANNAEESKISDSNN